MADAAATHSYWLLARDADEAAFLAEIASLADRLAAPRFHPHLTLAGDLAAAGADLGGGLAAIVAGIGGFEAPVAEIAGSEAYFRSFYARFDLADPLPELRRRAFAAADRIATDAFMPHVSLVYGPVEPAAKAAARAEVAARWTGRPIGFDRVALVRSSSSIPIADWRIEAVAALA